MLPKAIIIQQSEHWNVLNAQNKNSFNAFYKLSFIYNRFDDGTQSFSIYMEIIFLTSQINREIYLTIMTFTCQILFIQRTSESNLSLDINIKAKKKKNEDQYEYITFSFIYSINFIKKKYFLLTYFQQKITILLPTPHYILVKMKTNKQIVQL